MTSLQKLRVGGRNDYRSVKQDVVPLPSPTLKDKMISKDGNQDLRL